MPDLNAIIDDLVVGDSRNVRREISGVTKSDALTKAWLTVKVSATDEDADAVFQKLITTSAQATVGQITDDGSSDGVAEILFAVQASETALLTSTSYVYDIQYKTSSGAIVTIEKGTISPIGDVTKATS